MCSFLKFDLKKRLLLTDLMEEINCYSVWLAAKELCKKSIFELERRGMAKHAEDYPTTTIIGIINLKGKVSKEEAKKNREKQVRFVYDEASIGL